MRIKGFCRFSENTSEIIGLSGYGRLGLEVRIRILGESSRTFVS